MLQANYARAPFFKDVKDFVYSLYDIKTENLSEINISFIKSICKYLEIDTKIIDSRELNLKGNRVERLVDTCNKLNATTYLSGPAAKTYLDSSLFESKGIEVAWMDYSGYKEYKQLYPPFEHGVSILDLIFNEGPNAIRYMKSF